MDLEKVQSDMLAKTPGGGSFIPPTAYQIRLHPGLLKDFHSDYPFLDRRVGRYYLRPGPQRYLFRARKTSPGALAPQMRNAFRRALDGARIDPEIMIVDRIDEQAIEYNKQSIHPWALPLPQMNDIRFGAGRHEISKDVMVGERQRLIISAGAELAMAPGISIFSRGRVLLDGNSERPIVIKRLDPERAWGGITITGSASNGSLIRFSNISGGSFAHKDNIVSSGMLSIYGVSGTRIENSTISANVLSDDTLHVVYGDATLSGVSFGDCFGDCIDFDYTNGDIDGLTIVNAGNDGIDFMTSSARLRNINIRTVGDKGLSIGELSRVDVSKLRVERATTGIAVKDRSTLSAANSSIHKTSVGIDLYSKNWRYGGPGKAELTNITFVGNEVDARTEEASTLQLDKHSNPKTFAGDGTVEHAQ